MTGSRSVGIVVPRPVPPVRGGAERHWESVAAALVDAGHRPEIVGLDVPERSVREVIAGYRAFRALDVSRFDTVLTGKYPAWMIEHPDHVVHMLHPLRGVYEHYPEILGAMSDLPDGARLESDLTAAAAGGPDALLDWVDALTEGVDDDHPMLRLPGPFLRRVVHELDRWALSPSRIRAHAALSRTVADRAGYWPDGVAVHVVPAMSGLVVADAREPLPAFVTASRLDRPKRLDLMIDGFRAATLPGAELWIAGTGPDEARLRTHVGNDHRIRFLGRVSDERLAALYRGAVAVPFLPHDEDFGLVALEAMRAGRPVITCEDSGGVAEQVVDGETGFVVPPHAPYLADAFRRLWDDPAEANALGGAGRRRAASMTLRPLVELIAPRQQAAARPHILILSTFSVEPMLGGGQRRARELARRCLADADVTMLALAGPDDGHGARRRRLDDGLVEITVPRSAPHLHADGRLGELADLAVDDVAIARLHEASPAFAETLRQELATADAIVLAHPFLSTAIPADVDVPIVYDAHNAESELKSSLLQPSPVRDWLIETCRMAESAAVRRASLVSVTTAIDEAALRRLAPDTTANWTEIPNGVDTRSLTVRTDTGRLAARAEILRRHRLADTGQTIALFIGSWHLPNVEAATTIVEVARERRDILFVLAGGHTKTVPPSTPNVVLIDTFGEVERRRLLEGCDVALNPMTSGSGTNLKILDYLAVGIPVVSSSLGARGIDDPNEVLWIAGDDLADTIDRAIADPIETNRRSANGRRLVEEQFSWDVVGGRWADAVFESMGRQRGSSSLSAGPAPSDPAEEASMSDPFQDLVITTMWEGARRARGEPPLSGTHPMVLDRKITDMIAWAERHSAAGQDIPEDARLTGPKKALVRVGKVISNEQRVFNDAVVEVLKRLDDRTKGQAERAFDEARAHRLEEKLRRTNAELAAADEKVDRLRDLVNEIHEHHVKPLEASRDEQAHRLRTVMDDLVSTRRRLDRARDELIEHRARLSAAPKPTPVEAPSLGSADMDGFYEDLEDAFRGDPEDVRATQLEHADRLAHLTDGSAPVVDIGCGRGEWLSILSERGIPAVGVDLNREAVERCAALGLDAVHGDGIAHLHAVDPGTLGAVTAFHVVEHISTDELLTLLDAARRALRPGGVLLLETPNPENLVTAAVGFHLDPTHRAPLPPILLDFMARQRGFVDAEIIRLHPTGQALEIPAVGAEDHRMAAIVDEINHRFHTARDYALVARTPENDR